MSGHSKWHSIRHKKGANDAAKGKIFTKHAHLVTLAARGGGDPDTNPALRLAIDNARAENMPNANLERAIKKGTGEDKDAAVLMELTYEGYGPEGVAILVETLTDNKNRTVTGVRTAFSKNNGNMGESGSVAWMFHRKGVLTVKNVVDEKVEDLEMMAIEMGAEDVSAGDGNVEIVCDSKDVFTMKDDLTAEGFEVSAQVSMIAENMVKVESVELAQKIMRILDALEDHDDVSAVHSNAEMTEEVLKAMAE